MPWKHVFEPNPSDNSIKVHKNLPIGFIETAGWGHFKTARKPIKDLIDAHKAGKDVDHRSFYHCMFCKGWIEGKPYEYREDTLGPLCGRSGSVFSCIRCGCEIGFSGMVS